MFSTRLSLTLLFAVLTLLSVLLLLICHGSSQGRKVRADHRIITVSSLPAALEAWQKTGVHGRILVYIDRSFSFYPLDESAETKFIKNTDIRPNMLTGDNALWLAARSGVFRQLWYVVPNEKWDDISEKILQKPDVSRSSTGLLEYIEGIPVYSMRLMDLPVTPEKKLLFIGRKAADVIGTEKYARLINDSGQYDLVLINE